MLEFRDEAEKRYWLELVTEKGCTAEQADTLVLSLRLRSGRLEVPACVGWRVAYTSGSAAGQYGVFATLVETQAAITTRRAQGQTCHLEKTVDFGRTWQRVADDGAPMGDGSLVYEVAATMPGKPEVTTELLMNASRVLATEVGPPPGKPGLHLGEAEHSLLLDRLANLRGCVVGVHSLTHAGAPASECERGCEDVLVELARVEELVRPEGEG